MPIIGVIDSSKSGNLYSSSYESIATVTLTSSGAPSFTNIPQTYKHLQVRFIGRSTFSATNWPVWVNLNNNSGSNYSYHTLYGDGSTAQGFANTSQTIGRIATFPAASANANVFGSCVVDIHDYADTTKNTTVRTIGGYDENATGQIATFSFVWLSTAAVTSLYFGTASNFAAGTRCALYGIKGV